MKKIEKLNIHFETSAGYPRHKLEALHDKINELVDKVNNKRYEIGIDWGTEPDRTVIKPYLLDPDEHDEYNLNGDSYYGKRLNKELDWMDDPTLFLLDEQEEKKLLKNYSVDKPIKGDKLLFENFMYNEEGTFNIIGVGIPTVSKDPEKDLKDFFSKTALLYYGLWQKKDTFKERMSGKLFSNIKLMNYGKASMELKDKVEKKLIWYFENVQLSFEEMHDFDKPKENNIFYFERINLAMLENGRYQVEKWRTKLTEIKIGHQLYNEFLEFSATDPCQSVTCQYVEGEGKDLDNMTFYNAKITFVHAEDETYYMKPNEVLFLSAHDTVYARAIKKG